MPAAEGGGDRTAVSDPVPGPGAETVLVAVSPDRGAVVAALAATFLALVAAGAMVVGHPRWEGRELFGLVGSHGVHIGDLLAVIPLGVGLVLARWCLGR